MNTLKNKARSNDTKSGINLTLAAKMALRKILNTRLMGYNNRILMHTLPPSLTALYLAELSLTELGLAKLRVYSNASGMVENGSTGEQASMAWAVAKQLAAVSLSLSIDSMTRPRLYQDRWLFGSSLMAALSASSPSLGLPNF